MNKPTNIFNSVNMNSKYFAVFFFIISVAAAKLIDPFCDQREKCRIQSRLTKKQLANAKHHTEILLEYMPCFIAAIGIPTNKRGELDVEITASVVEPVVPRSLSIDITKCCNSHVVASGARTPGEQGVAFMKCLVATLAKPIFDATGYLSKPVYPKLGQCYRALDVEGPHHY